MKPILYEAGETNFTSNGLGRLSDATECTVTEERNGSYELNMKYPLEGIHFEDLELSRLIYAIPADGKDPQPFRIYYISKPMGGICEIKAEHISYQLSHIPVEPFEASTVSAALLGFTQHAAETCPFTFWTDKSTTATFKVTIPSSIRSLLGGTQGSILDAYGGEYEFDGYTVKLHNARGQNKGVSLRYGKNITDISQEENIQNTYTGVMPFWKGTANDVETTIMLTEKVLHSARAANFPYQRTIPLDLSSEFQEAPTEAQLRARAQAYMTANDIGIPSVSIKVSFLALWQTEEYKDIANLERVNLCDTVNVYFPKLDITATSKVVKTEYDVLNERYNSIELGDSRSTLASSIKQDIASETVTATANLPRKSEMQQAINKATQLITGGLGGHVVFTLNADGEPQEILIMDTDDVQTAVNVIRMNQNGIGFSTNGYSGPFNTAWTIDSQFVADFITTGTLDANLIKAGLLQDAAGKNTINMVTGDATLKGTINADVLNASTSGKIGNFDIASTELKYKVPPRYSSQTINQVIYPTNVLDGCVYMGEKGIQTYDDNYSASNLKLGVALAGRSIIFFDRSLNHVDITATPGGGYLNLPGARFKSDETRLSGDLTVDGDLVVIGDDKDRAVQTKDYGVRKINAYETASPMFGDVGSGIIEEDGLCHIAIDPILSETISTKNYYVFLQKEGDGECFVKEKTSSYFVVQGSPGLSFSWEIKAKQIDNLNKRLERFEEKAKTDNELNYADMAMAHIDSIKAGREIA